MADIQSRYSDNPLRLERNRHCGSGCPLDFMTRKVTIKYAGSTIQPDNPKLPDMLRKKSEIGKTSISKRQMITATKMRAVERNAPGIL